MRCAGVERGRGGVGDQWEMGEGRRIGKQSDSAAEECVVLPKPESEVWPEV